ncbi:C2 domain protein [Aspergillus glaucus CBS 516.65]|uniref:C2 domain-containing protein n=1 Tax=Aspergillus glaucus CBS 516.65 TaxID=1160497 RepID=A0A1L9VB58_ASPGL|nr:hypothetical protein ASPGLDRAFT_84565 [Aspergillus glaucus CBS 516.65]OJJ81119.1 hypothetical protein ASPGLDRAFT_84565 [Aspergillus glaucus CBS 516.65]
MEEDATTHLRVRPRHQGDKIAPKLVDHADELHDQTVVMKKGSSPPGDESAAGGSGSGADTSGSDHQPAGGFDNTPIPRAPPGYTLRFTFHRGDNLPFADFGSFSSDPYIAAHLSVNLPQRHKQDPGLTFRTPTVRKNLDPVWNSEWVVANVPASGFELKCVVFDEDAADHDDKLGNAYVQVNSMNENWPGIKEQKFKVKKRMGSKRVYIFGNLAAFTSRRNDPSSYVIISVECLGKTPGNDGGQVYTQGPNYWFKHFSPLIGRLAGTKDEVQGQDGKKSISRYNFQAIQMQFRGPAPWQLYHRYVEFRPFVAGMFTSQSLRGRILNRALHHQHERVYNFDRTTQNGQFTSPCFEMTQKFLEFAQYGQGGRIFTYVLTLDGQIRFTETGKEFGIDLLSKHTMHSNVSIYIAYSGEFFLRRRKHRHHRHRSRDEENEIPVEEDASTEISTDPADYELFIDNDSGTYRPNAKILHLLKGFLSANLPGLHITTLDCQADAERMGTMKNEQRECKKQEGRQITFLQQSSTSSLSISSSEEEELDEISGARAKQRGEFKQRMHEMRDMKGQVMKWAQQENDPNNHDHRHHRHHLKHPKHRPGTSRNPATTGQLGTSEMRPGTS